MQKYLVINADDFGLTRAVSDGIMEAFDRRNVSDVSMIANSSAFDHAVSLLKARNVSSCGIHLCFIDAERPLASDGATPILDGGRFHGRRGRFLMGYARDVRASLRFLEKELSLQIERLLGAGFQVTHADGHQHLHLVPGVSDLVVKLCARYRIPFVRIPVGDRFSPVCLAMRVFGRRLERLARRKGVRAIKSFGFKEKGGLALGDLGSYCRKMAASSEDIFELITHPGYGDEATFRRYSHWNHEWDRELETLGVLTEDYWREHGIQRVNFAQLTAASAAS